MNCVQCCYSRSTPVLKLVKITWQVKRIQETFSSVECYLNSFVVPLIEEMRTDLRSAMTNLPFAPAREILEIQISKNFHPPKALSYILKLKKSVNIFNVHEPEVGDLIALAEVRPKCVDDLNGPRFSYLVALVENMNDDPNSIEIVSSKLILLDDEEISGEENGKTRDTLFVIHLTNLKTNLRIWKALHPGEGGNMDILNSVLGVNPSVRFTKQCLSFMIKCNAYIAFECLCSWRRSVIFAPKKWRVVIC